MRPIAYLKILLPAIALGAAVNSGITCRVEDKVDAMAHKIETVDSTLKSWDAAMKPMVMEANAKKVFVAKNFQDSIAKVAKQHKIDSLENVVKHMKIAL